MFLRFFLQSTPTQWFWWSIFYQVPRIKPDFELWGTFKKKNTLELLKKIIQSAQVLEP